MDELYKKYRPTKFKDVLGQDDAVATLSSLVKKKKVPHAILFTGPSGNGKTTLARIMACKVDCNDHNLTEINCADFRGIEMVRDIRKLMRTKPLGGGSKVYLIDEAHRLTGDAQDALLKMLEDTPSHVYFFICTTNPTKLAKAIITRCTEVKIKLMPPQALKDLIVSVSALENFDISDEEVEAIVDCSEGSARKTLVILNQIMGIKDPEKRLAAIQSADTKAQAIDLCRCIMGFKGKPSWKEATKILKDLDDEPEGVRRLMLSYAQSVILGPNTKMHNRAFLVLNSFRDPFYDCGKPGLVAACFEVVVTP